MIDIGYELLFGPMGLVFGILFVLALLAELAPVLLIVWIVLIIMREGSK